MQKTWTRWEKTGEGVESDVANKASLSLRNAKSMIESSCEGGGGFGGVTPFAGEEETRFGGEGVTGRPRPGGVGATGGLRAGSDEPETLSSSEREAKADSILAE